MHQTMVIFDGEKRFEAYQTFNRIRNKVALAIFDDVNVVNGRKFCRMLDESKQVWW